MDTTSDLSAIDTLQAVCNLPRAEAESLLQSANGDIELAVRMGISQKAGLPPLARLREIVGDAAPDSALLGLLRSAGGIEAAASQYFEDPAQYINQRVPEAPPSSSSPSNLPSTSRRANQSRRSQPSNPSNPPTSTSHPVQGTSQHITTRPTAALQPQPTASSTAASEQTAALPAVASVSATAAAVASTAAALPSTSAALPSTSAAQSLASAAVGPSTSAVLTGLSAQAGPSTAAAGTSAVVATQATTSQPRPLTTGEAAAAEAEYERVMNVNSLFGTAPLPTRVLVNSKRDPAPKVVDPVAERFLKNGRLFCDDPHIINEISPTLVPPPSPVSLGSVLLELEPEVHNSDIAAVFDYMEANPTSRKMKIAHINRAMLNGHNNRRIGNIMLMFEDSLYAANPAFDQHPPYFCMEERKVVAATCLGRTVTTFLRYVWSLKDLGHIEPEYELVRLAAPDKGSVKEYQGLGNDAKRRKKDAKAPALTGQPPAAGKRSSAKAQDERWAIKLSIAAMPSCFTPGVKSFDMSMRRFFASIVGMLLKFGTGLCLGPYADGILNFCEEPEQEEPTDSSFTAQSVLASIRLPSTAPAAPAPPVLRTHPKPFQLQGLQWMLDRERKGDATGRGLLHLHPCWTHIVTPSGFHFYISRVSHFEISTSFVPGVVGGTCGGFLCDEMGLGKTLQMIMLMLSNPPPVGWPHPEDTPLKVRTDVPRGEVTAVPIKTTLVIVPSTILHQWKEELDMHVQRHGLSWCVYKPTLETQLSVGLLDMPTVIEASEGGRTKRATRARGGGAKGPAKTEDKDPHTWRLVEPLLCESSDGQSKVFLHKCDVCLMSYEHLRKALSNGSKSRLLNFGFWRVVLDEAQLVANTNSVAAVMASELARRHAWVLTGTPVSTNLLTEINGLCQFLAYEPVHHSEPWRLLVSQPFEEGRAPGLQALTSILRNAMLRRRKDDVADQLQLPPCTYEDRRVELSAVERECYAHATRRFQDLMAQYKDLQNRSRQQDPTVDPASLPTLARLMTDMVGQLTCMRQSCCHPQAARRADQMMGDKGRMNMSDIMGKLVGSAFTEYDNASFAYLAARLKAAAVHDVTNGDMGVLVRAVMHDITPLLDVTNFPIEQQVAVRGDDGSVVGMESSVPSPSGSVASSSSTGNQADTEAGRDAARRLHKLLLDGLVLIKYMMTKAKIGAEAVEGEVQEVISQLPVKGSSKEYLQGKWAAALAAELQGAERAKQQTRRQKAKEAGLVDEEEGEVEARVVVRSLESALRMKNPLQSMNTEQERLRKDVKGKFHTLSHLVNKQKALIGAAPSASTSPDAPADPSASSSNPPAAGAAQTVEQEEARTCVICLDLIERMTITACGHTFCTDCIHDYIGSGQNRGCPECRTSLTAKDLHDSMTDAEAAAAAKAKAKLQAQGDGGVNEEYGAKVCALLHELSQKQQQEPGAKSVVFSTWGRVLGLVGEALDANGVNYASTLGSSGARVEQLHRFLHDPDCHVLLMLMSHGSGAAGLTLTAASTAFIMEPALNPALEAQAAARVFRLGQSRPTHIIRFIAEGTVEDNVLRMQAWKAKGGASSNGANQKSEVDNGVVLKFFSNVPS